MEKRKNNSYSILDFPKPQSGKIFDMLVSIIHVLIWYANHIFSKILFVMTYIYLQFSSIIVIFLKYYFSNLILFGVIFIIWKWLAFYLTKRLIKKNFSLDAYLYQLSILGMLANETLNVSSCERDDLFSSHKYSFISY